MREAAQAAGLDPVAELYNEALRYLQEGHRRLARERLQMLLCMAPDDAEARLMLAQIHVASKRWADALAELDKANEHIVVPKDLYREVRDSLQAERAHRRDRPSVDLDRHSDSHGESRKLRRERDNLLVRVGELGGRGPQVGLGPRWGVSMVAILFVGGSL